MTGIEYRPKIAAGLMVALLVVAAAACGGGSSSDSAPAVVSSESTTTTTRASSGTTAGSSSSNTDLNNSLDALGGSTGSCVKIGLAYASISLSMLGGLGADQSQLTDAQTQLQDVQADIPAELKDDFETVSKAISSYATALKGLSGNLLDPAYQQQIEEAGKALDTPEFTSAQKNIENYLDANCPK